MVLGVASVATAGPTTFTATYEDSNTCPTGPASDFTGNERQYKVDDAIKCMYIDVTTGNLGNPTGGVVDTNNFLNSAEAFAEGWGPDAWTGLGGDPSLGGFSFTGGYGGSSGSFTIGLPLTSLYNQFAVAVKDGGDPKFAIFLLPENDFESLWSITSSGGGLSHFAVYGRLNDTEDPVLCPDGTLPPCPRIEEVPDAASSLLLMGMGLAGIEQFRRRRKQ